MFQQTFKNFNINFNVSNERGTFSSGDQMAGHVSFDLTKRTKITSVTMKLSGRAKVAWTTRRTRRNRSNNWAKLDLFDIRGVIMQDNSSAGETAELGPGTYVHPFTCQLPQGDFPSTFHGLNGQIVYNLTVGICRPWHMSKEYVTEFNFVNHIDTNQPELRAPLSGSNEITLCCLWCVSRPITIAVSLEKKAFIPGETVKIICEFTNSSSRTATPKVRLQQKQIYYNKNKSNKHEVPKCLVSVTGEPISAHTSDVHTEIMLTIPSSASLSISNCSILVVEYFIEVSLSSFTFPGVTVLFPIILCDTPVTNHPPPYFVCYQTLFCKWTQTRDFIYDTKM